MTLSSRVVEHAVPSRAFYVMGIGASAGGLGALRTLFSKMPPNPGIACVVVVHLSPEHDSHLVELLQPYTSMPVQQVTQTIAIEPNRVYVIPPNANLDSIDTHLRLSELERRRVERAPIDHFMRTLAATHDGLAVGVILTGAGSDGSLGLRQIKEHGGLTIVQDPMEAEYDSMPRSAIATGFVDIVTPLREIPERVLGYCATKPRLRIPADGNALAHEDAGPLAEIVAEVTQRTGHDCSVFRRSALLERIRHRMQVRQTDTLAAYLALLREGPDEAVALAGSLHHAVVDFFQPSDVFTRLERDLIPELFAGKVGDTDRLRAWSIGCSTGEVAYSLAMLLLEHAGHRPAPSPRLQVFATDSSDELLDLARAGIYPHEIAATISPPRLERFFSNDVGHYRVKTELRDVVMFAAQDVFKDPPFSHLDIIVCPSPLANLQPEVRRGVLRLFHFALEPDGVLVVGPDDAIDEPQLFEWDGGTTRIFRRRPGPRLSTLVPQRHASAPRAGVPAARPNDDLFAAAHREALERHVVPSVLVDDDNRIVHYSPRAWGFLRIPGGELSHDVLALVSAPLRAPLEGGLAEARRLSRSWVSEPLAALTEDGPRRLLLRVEPAGEVADSKLTLVMFDELADSVSTAAEVAGDVRVVGTIDRLDNALQRTNLRLRTVVDQSAGATAGTAPGEKDKLRAILGELESSREEMRAVNTELMAMDLAKRRRIEILAQQSADSYQLLQATGIATLFLDADLRVLRHTPALAEIFHVGDADAGRGVSELTHSLDYPDLVADARRVLTHRVTVQREVSAAGDRWYLMRMLPYRPVPAYISGVAITLVDITDRRRAEEVLRQTDRRKDEFVALLAHELRNPLAPIASGIELLRMAASDHDMVRKVVPMMRRQVRQLVRMVDDLLEASRLSGGRLRLQKAAVLIADIVRDATAAVAPLIEQLQHHLDVRVTQEALVLEADGARLTQVLSNLLTNAARYTPSGGHITVQVTRERNEAVITVTDTGVGMSEDVLRNVFDMFYRGGDGRSSGGDSGLGIGLAIASQLVTMHGGTLTARSAGPGRGSQFEMRLPASADVTPPVSATEPSLSQVRGHRVLVVDDNADAAAALSLQLEAMGAIEVCTALGGEEALRRGPQFQPDVVLLDLGMPDMDGFEVARRLRQQAWGQNVTLVAVTGWGQDEHRQRTRDAGFDRHLVKPAARADIEAVLAEAEAS